MFRKYLLSLPRRTKKIIFLCHDLIIFLVAFWLSVSLSSNFSGAVSQETYWLVCVVTIILSLVLFANMGLYRSMLRYMGNKLLILTIIGSVVSASILVLVVYFSNIALPRTVSISYFLLLLLLLLGSRFLIKLWLQEKWHIRKYGEPVVIYGAGESGRQLQEALKQLQAYYPVAFVDDNSDIHKSIINNISVFSRSELPSLVERFGVKKILLAIPSASIDERRNILRYIEPLPCEVLTIPGMKDILDGKLAVNALRKVSVLDLLGRTPVEPNTELLAANITGKVVMVTGAGGSIGSELCRQIIQNKPKVLVLFELSEFGLYSIEKELCEYIDEHQLSISVIPLLGSVQRLNRLETVMKSYGVQTLYHAAAYKHVPIVEYNMVEGIRNNVFGTLYCAQAAISAQVETFVLISTDKAVRPTNVMGTTKRMAELVLQALSSLPNQQVRFCMVRFGNVLGSSGSVVPVFEKQIAQGGPITLTHPEITRFFMTIPEAAQLVIQAGAMGRGGDVFVLDMGQPVKIIDLAQQMIRLSGLTVRDEHHPDGDIEIKITGLRPGEKLYEELLVGDNVSGTSHSRIMMANETYLQWPDFEAILVALDRACEQKDFSAIRKILVKAPTGYTPTGEIVDLIWQTQAS